MTLPLPVTEILSKLLEKTSLLELQHARASLSHVYQTHPGNLKDFTLSHLQALSYLATRLPATYAVCLQVLQHLQQIDFTPQSLLDIGAGPGTASLACCEIFPTLSQMTLYDRESFLRDIATQLLAPYTFPIHYHLSNVIQTNTLEKADLVMCSYALGEIPSHNRHDVLKKMWEATQKVLVLIEPGTPFGFSVIKEARSQLIPLTGKIIAPCTHENTCPLSPQDWCHFSARVERSSCHKKIKRGSLGYEDEKYSYLIVSKKDCVLRSEERIIRPLLRGVGHVTLDLCGPAGLRREIISRRQKNLYQKSRKLRWGDAWDTQE